MSYNGSGTFNINTAGQPVVTGTTITSTAFNLLTADLATGLSTALTKDGQTTPTANIPMGTFKITGLGAGTAATDAAQFGQLQAGATQIATVTGTDTIAGTLTPTPTAYATGNLFSFVAANTNTGAATINLNSLGAKSITKLGSTALAAGDLVSGRIYLIEYDGTRFQLINPSASSVSSFSAGSTGFTPSTATTGAVTLAGTLATTNGGTGLTSFTANQVFYASSTSAFAQSANLLYSGTDLTVYGITVGRGAGAVATNTAVGASALAGNSTGLDVLAVGYQAYKNGTGSYNHAIGFNAMGTGVVTGNQNVAIARYALNNLTSGNYNVALGDSSLESNTTGSNNFAAGTQALKSNTTASNSTAVGYQAAYSSSIGSQVVAIGYRALYSSTVSNFNVAVGSLALTNWNNTGADGSSVAVGYQALQAATTGNFNTAVGYQAGYSSTTTANNTTVGYRAGYNNTGASNTLVGVNIGAVNVMSGSYNVAMGDSALYNASSGANNTAVGYQAGYSNVTGAYNLYLGYQSGLNATGAQNCFVGAFTGSASTGSYNTFVGLGQNSGAGQLMTTGSKNTILGAFSGNQGGLDIRTASNYIVLSDGDGNPRAYQSSTGGWFQYNNLTVWSITSDIRIKKNVVSLESGLSVIQALRPVEFDYIENDKHDIGFIAQEYQTVLPEQINVKDDGMLSLNQNLVPYLVKAIQELKAEIDSLKSQLNGA